MGELTRAVRARHDLKPKEKAVLMALAHRLDEGEPTTTLDLAQDTGYSKDTALRALQALADKGLVGKLTEARGRRAATWGVAFASQTEVLAAPQTATFSQSFASQHVASQVASQTPHTPRRKERPEPSAIEPQRFEPSTAVEVRSTNHSEASNEGADRAADASQKRVELPEGFPEELRPHLRAAYAVLRDVARRIPGAKEPSPVALARVVMARPRKPIVLSAHDYAAWAEGKRVKDVVAGYRNWLNKADDLAALEVLPGQEPPATATPPRRRRGGGIQQGDFAAALARRQARERGEG